MGALHLRNRSTVPTTRGERHRPAFGSLCVFPKFISALINQVHVGAGIHGEYLHSYALPSVRVYTNTCTAASMVPPRLKPPSPS